MTFSTSATIKNTIDPLKTLIIEVVKTGSTLPIQSTTDPVVNNTDQAVATNQGGTGGTTGTTGTTGSGGGSSALGYQVNNTINTVAGSCSA